VLLPTVEFLRECFVCDPDAGTLHWRKRPADHFLSMRAAAIFNTRFANKPAGHTSRDGYSRIFIAFRGVKKPYLAHRIIWAMVTGKWPENHIDHKNKTPSGNYFANLREATNAENMRNSGLRRDNQVGRKGVRERNGKFTAQIQVDGKSTHLGTFATIEQASAAYAIAAQSRFGEFARVA